MSMTNEWIKHHYNVTEEETKRRKATQKICAKSRKVCFHHFYLMQCFAMPGLCNTWLFFLHSNFFCVFYPIDRSIFPCIEKMACIWSRSGQCVWVLVRHLLEIRSQMLRWRASRYVICDEVCSLLWILDTLHMHIGNVVLFNWENPRV